jgi:hypothetical protein
MEILSVTPEKGVNTEIKKIIGERTSEIDIRYAIGRATTADDKDHRPRRKGGNLDGYMELDFEEHHKATHTRRLEEDD